MARGSELPVKWHLTNEVYGKLISLKKNQVVGARFLRMLRRENKMKLPVLIGINLPLKISSKVLSDYASFTRASS